VGELDEVGRVEVDGHRLHDLDVRLEPRAEAEATMDARRPVLVGVAIDAPVDGLLAPLTVAQK